MSTSMSRSGCVPLSDGACGDIKGAMWFQVSLGGVFMGYELRSTIMKQKRCCFFNTGLRQHQTSRLAYREL